MYEAVAMGKWPWGSLVFHIIGSESCDGAIPTAIQFVQVRVRIILSTEDLTNKEEMW